MKYIENSELREWVKENLRKSIFQKAHALAVQTGCEILVKLEDLADLSASQYYATRKLQQAYRRGCLRQRPGEMCISGETGLPATLTVDMAVQSCDNVASEPQDVIGSCNTENTQNGDAVNHNTNNSSTTPIHLTKHVSNKDTVEEKQAQITDSPPKHPQSIDNAPGDAVHVKSGENESEMTNTPANVKLEVEEVFEERDGGIDRNDTLDEDEDDTMEALPPEEDMYDDYYGTGGLEDASNQMASDNSMFQPTGLGLDNHLNSGQQYPPHIGREVSASDINQMQNMASATQNPSSFSHTTNSVGAGPISPGAWSRARASLPSSRMYRAQGPSVSKRNPNIGRPLAQQQNSLNSGNQVLSADTVDVHLSYPVTLPTFSHHVQRALENGTIHGAKVWSQFCKEAAQFYLPMLDICDTHDKHSSNVYQSIGRTMYEKYPCIIGVGVRPWTYFNKWLSTKIRQARFREKKKDQEF